MAPKKTFVVHGFKCTATMDRANSLLLTVSVGASSKDWPRKRLNKDVDLEAAAAQIIRAATSPQPESHQSQPDAPCSESVEGPIDGSAGHAGPSTHDALLQDAGALFESPDQTLAHLADIDPAADEPRSLRGADQRWQPERFGVADIEFSAADLSRFDKSCGVRHARQPERECMRANCVAAVQQ